MFPGVAFSWPGRNVFFGITGDQDALFLLLLPDKQSEHSETLDLEIRC